MKFYTGGLLQKGCIRLLGHQSDAHFQSLAGLQETGTESGLSARFKNCRNGYHVLPTATDTHSTYLTGADMEITPTQKIMQHKILTSDQVIQPQAIIIF